MTDAGNFMKVKPAEAFGFLKSYAVWFI